MRARTTAFAFALALALPLGATAPGHAAVPAAGEVARAAGALTAGAPERRRRRRRPKKKAPLTDRGKKDAEKAATSGGGAAASAGGAPAAAAGQPGAGGGRGLGVRRSNRMEFDARLVQGERPKAGAVYLFERSPRRLPPLVKLRQSYVREIIVPVLGVDVWRQSAAASHGIAGRRDGGK